MLNFLFWNLNQKRLETIVANLGERHALDVVILAECPTPIAAMLQALNGSQSQFRWSFSNCDRLAVYCRFDSKYLQPASEGQRFSIRRLTLPARPELLLAVAHLPSKLRGKDEDQAHVAFSLGSSVREVEQRVGHRRTLVVGDLNMDPFEPGVVGVVGLHGTRVRQIAQRRSRVVSDREYDFFYNPMWKHFGASGEQPPGTYYRSSGAVAYFWHVFDQVLLRPDLLPYFHEESVQILASDGTHSLVSGEGVPDAKGASDHLPILFQLDV